MMGTWTRLAALIVKELLAVTRDPRARIILIVPPIAQLVIFAFAATLNVTGAEVAVLNRDSGRWSRELIQRIEHSPYFGRVERVEGTAELENALVEQRAIALVHLSPTFSRDLEADRTASVQIILDGRKSNASQIVAGYLNAIITELASEAERRRPAGRSAGATLEVRNWFNPNLDDRTYMVPSLVAIISLLMGLVVTALSIAREREVGTFEQLMVSPLRTHEILAGKVIPPMLICLFHITLFLVIAVFAFGIPFRGSVPLLYASAFFYLYAVVGIGLFISAVAATQQQAIFGAFLFMVPAMILSGFVTPIENMPHWLRPITLANPVRHFLIVVKGVFLKAMPAREVVGNTIPLFFIGTAAMAAAAWLFRRRME